jgi:hypothetical protein
MGSNGLGLRVPLMRGVPVEKGGVSRCKVHRLEVGSYRRFGKEAPETETFYGECVVKCRLEGLRIDRDQGLEAERGLRNRTAMRRDGGHQTLERPQVHGGQIDREHQ